MEGKVIKAYKAFNKDLSCRGFQYEVGKEYEIQGDIQCCKNGFHACENPFDVLEYYWDLSKNRFCEVEMSGEVDKEGFDSKIAASKIKIKKEIGFVGLFRAGIEWIKELTNPRLIIKETECTPTATNDYGESGKKIGSSDDDAQIGSSGNCAKIGSSGDRAQINSSGSRAKIGSSGYGVQISSSGAYTQIVSSGNCAKIGSCGNSAKIGSSGDSAKIDSIGHHSYIGSSGNNTQIASSGGYTQIESSGENSIIYCTGLSSVVKAKKGSWITLAEWADDGDSRLILKCVKAEYVDGDRIKEDTWYKLVGGEFVEV